jgi:hypothetical protein
MNAIPFQNLQTSKATVDNRRLRRCFKIFEACVIGSFFGGWVLIGIGAWKLVGPLFPLSDAEMIQAERGIVFCQIGFFLVAASSIITVVTCFVSFLAWCRHWRVCRKKGCSE